VSQVTTHEIKKGIWEIVLNRPEKLNALSAEFTQNTIEALAGLKSKVLNAELRVLLISSSSEKAFCSGADLGERIKMSVDQIPEALDHLRILMDGVEVFPVPTIAVMDGIAFGGGLELALACDLRVASKKAQMGLTETRLAIIPGAGGTQRLARIVGMSKAKEWIYTAKKISAAEAMNAGLVSYVEENPRQKAIELAEEIVKAGPIAIVSAKRAIAGGWNLDLPSALDWERKCYLDLLNSEDRVEGLAAFSEKRAPLYKGL
jgi:enoyl-CoA hydratase/carnithine racemase